MDNTKETTQQYFDVMTTPLVSDDKRREFKRLGWTIKRLGNNEIVWARKLQ